MIRAATRAKRELEQARRETQERESAAERAAARAYREQVRAERTDRIVMESELRRREAKRVIDPCTCTDKQCPRHRGFVRDGRGAWVKP